ncbi:hypothetical protein GPUN_1769 [Glaciecola punicea ACAM 611]|uniref:Uncharacterized protein n=1 Tax=Glaciecola punicea ACAM 611 TaxID=1121923 RepID=H5TC58_9ALTE|nr:hypothetical protein [Glaciecola punicea]OFA32058.1 hypothetical protein BAE46_07410 [Glaciecola punicea]GAB55885.1 hypothetical protein GPUN_1769 [Glaciecola punicea ACAM 611]
MANGDEKILLTSKKMFEGVDGSKYRMSVFRDVTEKEILIHDLKRPNEDLAEMLKRIKNAGSCSRNRNLSAFGHV